MYIDRGVLFSQLVHCAPNCRVYRIIETDGGRKQSGSPHTVDLALLSACLCSCGYPLPPWEGARGRRAMMLQG